MSQATSNACTSVLRFIVAAPDATTAFKKRDVSSHYATKKCGQSRDKQISKIGADPPGQVQTAPVACSATVNSSRYSARLYEVDSYGRREAKGCRLCWWRVILFTVARNALG